MEIPRISLVIPAYNEEESLSTQDGTAPRDGGFDMQLIEHINADGQTLAIIVRSQYKPDSTVFLTRPNYKQQVGFVVYPAGGEIARHSHRKIERALMGTSEVVVVQQGRCEAEFFDDNRRLVATRELQVGDVMLMVDGGHGFRMLEDTVFLEVKQGPYLGVDEKELF